MNPDLVNAFRFRDRNHAATNARALRRTYRGQETFTVTQDSEGVHVVLVRSNTGVQLGYLSKVSTP